MKNEGNINLVPQSRFLTGIAFGFMVTFLILGLGLSLVTPGVFSWQHDQNLFDGEWTAHKATTFDEQLPIRQFGINVWGVIEFALFSQGRSGVLIGSDGWLFTSSEFRSETDAEIRERNNLELIKKVKLRLEAGECALAVALVPAKARVYSDKLAPYQFPRSLETRYRRFLEGLQDLGICAPDLSQALNAARVRRETYLRTDTHWSPLGAQIVAETIAAQVQTRFPIPSFGLETFQVVWGVPTQFEGDLLRFVPLGKFASWGPKPDRIVPRETDAANDSSPADLFAVPKIPVALVGTSYSASLAWDFEGSLKVALGADVLNVASEGRGPITPMLEYLDSAEFVEFPPELVVWEYPERYIAGSFTQEPQPEISREGRNVF